MSIGEHRNNQLSNDPAELLAAAYALDGPDANRELYARWASTYDTGFVTDSGYGYPSRVAEVFESLALGRMDGTDNTIIDIGCGTGLAGLALRAFTDLAIDGIDISPEMLGQAAEKTHGGQPVYRQLYEADLTAPFTVTSGYAAALSSGLFTHGHVGPDAIDGLLGLVRPGGRFVLGINAAHFDGAGFGTVLDRLSAENRIRDLQYVMVPIYSDSSPDDSDRMSRVTVFEVA